MNDADVRNHLNRYFDRYVDHRGQPAHTVTIATFEDRGFEELAEVELEEMREALHCLAFATIAPRISSAVCAKDRNNGPPSADAFEFLTQNFIPGIDELVVQAGSLTNAGLRIDEITFAKPWALGGPAWQFSRHLVKSLNNSLASGACRVRERICRALEWFLMAQLESGPVSRNAKLVLMSTAFEILLQLPVDAKKWPFVEAIEKVFRSDDLNPCTRPTRKGVKKVTMAGAWAYDFYELRNKIVHGAVVQPEALLGQSGWSHNVVASVVFFECVERELLFCGGKGQEKMKQLLEERFATSENAILELFWVAHRAFSGVEKALGWSKDLRVEDEQNG